MTTIFDPDERLRAANPVDETTLSPPWESAAAQRLFEKITGSAYAPPPQPQPQPVPARRRHWRVYVTSLVAAVTLGSGVAYAVIFRQPSKRLAVVCYAQPGLAGRVVGLTSNGRDPVGQCRTAWAAGHVGRGAPPADLVGCVLASGPVGVFPRIQPTDDVCRRLGLPPFDGRTSGSSPTSIDPVVAMRDAVVAALSRSCVGSSDAEALVRQVLARDGLTDWTVALSAPFSADRPCASPGFDEPGHRVVLIPNSRSAR